MSAGNKFSPEFGDRAVRMVDEHQGDYTSDWAAMTLTAGKVGCKAGTLRRANELLRKASACSAIAKLDCGER